MTTDSSLRMPAVPRYIYKYHDLNLHLMEMLTNAEFHMSRKTELNDPFDLTYRISMENYITLYHQRYPSLEKDNKQLELVKFCFARNLEDGSDAWAESIEENITNLRVTCFTEDGNNPLMWSHYSNNHSGVCLKFDTEQAPGLSKALEPVRYADKLVEVVKMADFKSSLLTKLSSWSVEKEWRIITQNEKFPFPQEALVEITFGLRVPTSTIRWFRQFSENVYYIHTPIYTLKIRNQQLVKVNEWDEEMPLTVSSLETLMA